MNAPLLELPPSTTAAQRLAELSKVFEPACWAALSEVWRSAFLAQLQQLLWAVENPPERQLASLLARPVSSLSASDWIRIERLARFVRT